jgi:TorA maturation chaperone TorD
MESPMIEDLKEERQILSLLKHIFLKEPAKEFLQELGEINIVTEENDIDKGLNLIAHSVRANKDRLDEYAEDLAVEFARLFIGPKNPPAIPYASFYLSELRAIMTDITIDVRKKYLEAGMAVKDLYSMPEDHIGIELEFISYLTEKIIDLYEKGERGEASRLFELRNKFKDEHMASWAPLFADKILSFTNDNFYRGSAIMLKGLISLIPQD